MKMKKSITITTIICLTILILVLALIVAVFYHQILETPYEKCIEKCTSYNVDCLENCNDAVENIIGDLTDSIDKLDWEKIIK